MLGGAATITGFEADTGLPLDPPPSFRQGFGRVYLGEGRWWRAWTISDLWIVGTSFARWGCRSARRSCVHAHALHRQRAGCYVSTSLAATSLDPCMPKLVMRVRPAPPPCRQLGVPGQPGGVAPGAAAGRRAHQPR